MVIYISLNESGVPRSVSLLPTGAKGEMPWPLDSAEFQKRACLYLSGFHPDCKSRHSTVHLAMAAELISRSIILDQDTNSLARAVLHLLAYNPEVLTRIQELLHDGNP